MKTRILILSLAVILTSGLAAKAVDPIGTIIALQGKATATGADGGAARNLELKSPIYLNDKVSTAEGAKLQIQFADDTIVSQGEKSEMTVDKYVYSPEKKDENSTSIRMAKGVFRVITGRITKLNPERFNVKTKMATIGIRGCDLGFSITEKGENIYVIALHGKESITIELTAEAKGLFDGLTEGKWGPDTEKKLLNVLKSGMVVSITAGEGLDQRELTPDEAAALIQSVTPEGASDGAEGEGTDGGGTDTGTDTGTGEGAGGEGTEGGGTDTGSDTGTGEGTGGEGSEGDGSGLDGGGGDLGLDLGGALGTGGDVGGGVTPPDSVPPEIPDIPPEAPTDAGGGGATSVFTSRGGGTDWSWGVWETGGLVDKVDFTSPAIISAADAQTIIDGTTLHDLSGSGSAAATIQYGGAVKLVEGSADLSVQIGNRIAPTWDGIFSMNNLDGDTLTFDASGTIQRDGTLTGNQTGYSMQVNGAGFDRNSITAETIGGNIVGPGSGATPITGAIGTFHFEHGGSATVDGGFGSDLAP